MNAADTLRIAQVSFFCDPQGRAGEALLEAWPSLADIARAAASAGLTVSVLQAAARPERLERDGVGYHFLCREAASAPLASGAAFRALLAQLRPQVLHVHGLHYFTEVGALAAAAPGVPILLQDHASRVPGPWRWLRWRRGLGAAAAVSFCAREQAEPFRRRHLLRPQQRLYGIPESTSRFTPGDATAARRATGLHGDPCLLWVGHLDANKDPLTVLDGLALARDRLPDPHLWCYFGSAPLRAPIERRLRREPRLAHRVHLLGAAPHAHIEAAMRAADLFVLGSHHEGSGYALLEALACALPPVVTAIPSFRALAGTAGFHWRCDDAADCARALLAAQATPRAAARQAARAQFERELSFAALGSKLHAAYADLAAGMAGARRAA